MTYYLLSKEDFAALYKFGEVGVKVGAAAESDDPREAVKKLFSASDSFEYAQERLIVSSEKASPGIVRMVDVKDIFPLDVISRNLFKSQFNPAIIFREPVFQDIAEDFLKNTVLERTTVSGINALRSVFGLEPEKDEGLIADIIRGKTFLRKLKYYEVPFEERTPYSMLIAYNRYQHYPKDKRGFFYDAADCFMYGSMYSSLIAKGIPLLGYDREIVANLCHSFFELLDSIPSSAPFTKIAGIVEDSNPRISEAVAPVYGSIRFLALYFYVKEQIRAEETVSLKGLSLLNTVGKKYPEDFPKLLTLIGGFLGYTWVYDRLYEFQDCPFLSIHHSLDDFIPKEPVAQPEPAPVPLSEESASGMPEQDEPLSQETQEAAAVQPEGPLPEEPSTLTQPGPQETVVSEGNAENESVLPDAGPTIPQVEGVQEETEAETPQPETDQAPVVPEPGPNDASEGSSVESNPTMGNAQDEGLDIDIPSIVKALFRNKSKRRDAFEKALINHHDEVLRLALEKDDTSLRGLYLKLDKEFKPAKELQKQDSFVKACLALKPPMFDE